MAKTLLDERAKAIAILIATLPGDEEKGEGNPESNHLYSTCHAERSRTDAVSEGRAELVRAMPSREEEAEGNHLRPCHADRSGMKWSEVEVSQNDRFNNIAEALHFVQGNMKRASLRVT
ncbi:hypothetical protein FACS1894159_01050 [Bacteroidia bacterium]|nr:hypothetical protein FACS1894159_01050 [Bacteroidia bacterium]